MMSLMREEFQASQMKKTDADTADQHFSGNNYEP